MDEKQTKILGDDFAHHVIQTWMITDHKPFLGSISIPAPASTRMLRSHPLTRKMVHLTKLNFLGQCTLTTSVTTVKAFIQELLKKCLDTQVAYCCKGSVTY